MSGHTRPGPQPLTPVLAHTALTILGNGVVTTGIFFIAARRWGFGDTENLLLALAVNLPYSAAALAAGPLTRRFGERATAGGAVVALALISVLLGLDLPAWTLWITAPAYNAAGGLQWPITEGWIAGGREGTRLQRALGAFNLTWAGGVIPSLWITGLFLDNPAWVFALLALCHALSLPIVLSRPPAAHHAGTRTPHAPHQHRRYRLLLNTAHVLLPASYVLVYVVTPLLPGLWAEAGVGPAAASALTSTRTVTRLVCFGLMAAYPGWHGRLRTPVAALLWITAGTLLTLWGGFWPILAGQALFGWGQGQAYTIALYYAMLTAKAEVDSGGRHEAVIGAGYALGPVLGLAGEAAAVNVPGAPRAGVLFVTTVFCAVAAGAALRYIAAARRAAREAR